MKNKFNSKVIIAFSTIATVMFLSAGCGTKTSQVPKKLTEKPKNVATNILSAPKGLDKITSNAEKIMTEIDKKNWKKAEDSIKSIEKEKNTLKPILKASMVSNKKVTNLNSAVSKLKKAVMNKNALAGKLEANKVKKAVPDIKDTYKNNLPTDLDRIDAMTRDVIINTEINNKKAAKDAYKALNAKWTTLRNQMDNKYKSDADKFDKFSTNLARSLDLNKKDMIKSDAKKLLDHLKVIKNNFNLQYKK